MSYSLSKQRKNGRMDVISATGQERARFQTWQEVNSDEFQTVQVFLEEALTTRLMQEATEEVGDRLTREMEKCETSQTGSGRDRCRRQWQLHLHSEKVDVNVVRTVRRLEEALRPGVKGPVDRKTDLDRQSETIRRSRRSSEPPWPQSLTTNGDRKCDPMPLPNHPPHLAIPATHHPRHLPQSPPVARS